MIASCYILVLDKCLALAALKERVCARAGRQEGVPEILEFWNDIDSTRGCSVAVSFLMFGTTVGTPEAREAQS